MKHPMTDFEKWYDDANQDIPDVIRNRLRAEHHRSYEAGAASQAKTLRDEFAGQSLAGLAQDESVTAERAGEIAYAMADAMLEARKPPEEDQGSRSDPNVESAVTEGSDFPCIDYDAKDALARVLADDGMSICGADEVARVAVNLLDRAGWQITRKDKTDDRVE
jgi:hypothetical protein